eukprot:GHVH01007235.1.p1 GENE.GHVH01007235.1~~GHVH01007235.1.p1  ORF type:complete len:362 (+),score=33.32 GHVH01007235.1:719-1804(+)
MSPYRELNGLVSKLHCLLDDDTLKDADLIPEPVDCCDHILTISNLLRVHDIEMLGREARNDLPPEHQKGLEHVLHVSSNELRFGQQLWLLLEWGLYKEFKRVYQFVDLLQLTFELSIQLIFYYQLLENKDGPSGAFWDDIGPLFTMNIMCLYRGSFTAMYGEHSNRPVVKQDLLSNAYSRSAYITFRMITTFLVGLPWPVVYYLLAMLIQGGPFTGGRILSGMIGLMISYSCGQLTGLISSLSTRSFNKSVNIAVVLNWFQLMPSGSFHNADTLATGLKWMPYCTFLYYAQAMTLVGVTDLAMEYTCDGSPCDADEIFWGVKMMGYNGTFGFYLACGLAYYCTASILTIIAFFLSKSYQPL